jgi:L-asparaginase II
LRHVAYAGGDVVAEVVRSGFVEGFHRGSVAVLDAGGKLIASAGDPYGAVFPRSSNKPMQAVGMLRAGLKLDDPADLAQVCASHSGQPFHIARVRGILAAGGIAESELRTPPDYPLAEAARNDLIRAGIEPAPIYMNCSGKHSGMLRTCAANGWAYDDYRAADHPLQVVLRDAVEDIASERVEAVGVDGCGAPVLSLSLAGLAGAYLRIVGAEAGSDERRVADAMRAHPDLVSGTGADDDLLMRGVPGLLSKGGAEGVLAVAVPGAGAVALKIDDGAKRARVVVLASALRRIDVAADVLDQMSEFALLGGGRPVGAVRSVTAF